MKYAASSYRENLILKGGLFFLYKFLYQIIFILIVKSEGVLSKYREYIVSGTPYTND